MLPSFAKKITPTERGVYAVEHGDFVGEFFVFIKTNLDGSYEFLCLPKMIRRTVPEQSFASGIKDKIINFVEKLPKNVYKMCQAQYESPNKTPVPVHISRKKQLKQHY
ncbi:hypothetical protein EBR43_04825 [bacterium]|nr:hypothetical protein [bacterium]